MRNESSWIIKYFVPALAAVAGHAICIKLEMMSHISMDPRIKATIEHLEAESHQAVAHIEQAKKDSNDYDFEETIKELETALIFYRHMEQEINNIYQIPTPKSQENLKFIQDKIAKIEADLKRSKLIYYDTLEIGHYLTEADAFREKGDKSLEKKDYKTALRYYNDSKDSIDKAINYAAGITDKIIKAKLINALNQYKQELDKKINSLKD